jgi:hypothetical protein
MKTKGKANKPHKRACKPSPDSHLRHPKKLRLESLKGVLTIDQVKGCFLFLKMVYGGVEGGQGHFLGQMGRIIILL